MTAADHANTVRDALLGLADQQAMPDDSWRPALSALDALQAQAEAADQVKVWLYEQKKDTLFVKAERDRLSVLAALVSGVLCDAETIPVAETTDVKGLHQGLRALLAERDAAVRELDDVLRAEWVWKDRAEAAEHAAEQARAALQQVCAWVAQEKEVGVFVPDLVYGIIDAALAGNNDD